MTGKTSKGAAQPKKGRGNGRNALSELDPNVQLSRAASPGGDVPDLPTGSRRSTRQAAKSAGAEITRQYAETSVVDSLPRPNKKTRSNRPGASLPTRVVSDSDEDFPLDSPPSGIAKVKGRRVPAVPDSDEDFQLSEGAGDDLDDLDDIYEKRILCPENDDAEEDGPSDHSDSDLEEEESEEEETAPTSAKARGKRPAPVKKVAGSRRAPKRAKAASANPGKPGVQETAKQWLQRVNDRSGIKPDDENVLKFQYNTTQLVHRVSHLVRGAGSFQKVAGFLAKSTYKLFESTDRDEICSLIFAHMPLQAQNILGKPDLQVKDLLRLPTGATVMGHMGTYLDILGKYSPSSIEVKPHPDYNLSEIKGVRTLKDSVYPASATEFGLYDGSSYGKKGLKNRVREHISEMNRPDSDKKSSAAHYTLFGNDHNAVPNFRLTSVWNQGGDRRYPVLVEGLVMTYLGLQNDGKDDYKHPAETFEMNLKLRGGLSLPNFMSISLNRAWPLFQGLGLSPDESKELAIRKETKEKGCANPGHNPKNSAFSWLRFLMTASGKKEWRCSSCREFMQKNDGRDITKEDYVRVCGNPRHRSEMDHEGMSYCRVNLNGSETWRCTNCYWWFNNHGIDWPITKDGEDVSLRGSRPCENPAHPADSDALRKVYMNSAVGGLRCAHCRKWIWKHGHDYPINKNGDDITARAPLVPKVCENPNHPEDRDASLKVHNSGVMGALRCEYCGTWARKNGCDYPIKKNGEDVTLTGPPPGPKVCGNPTHPEDRDPHLKVSNCSVVGSLRCTYCTTWAHKNGCDYPIKKNGEDVTAT